MMSNGIEIISRRTPVTSRPGAVPASASSRVRRLGPLQTISFFLFALFCARSVGLAQTEAYFEEVLEVATQVQASAGQISDPPNLGPVPVRVGTFDAASGKFSWHCSLKTYYEFEDRPAEVVPPGCTVSLDGVRIIRSWDRATSSVGTGRSRPPIDYRLKNHVAEIDAFLVELIIGLKNNTQGVLVTVLGQSSLVPPQRLEFRTIAPISGSVAFSLSSGGKSFTMPIQRQIKDPTDPELYRIQMETFTIQAPRVRVGAGSFTVPALPVALVYQPPWGEPQTLREESKQAVTVKTLFGGAEDLLVNVETHPLTFLVNMLSIILAVSGQPGNEAIAADAGKIETIKGLLEPLSGATIYEEQVQTQLQMTSEHTVDVTLSFGMTYPTTPALGPGAGDTTVYLRDVVFVWGGYNDQLVLTPIGYRKLVVTSVDALRSNPFGSPPSSTPLDSLIELDPQADPTSPLEIDAGRFVSCQAVDNDLDVSIQDVSARYEFSETHLLAEAYSTTTIEDEDANPIAKFFGAEETIISKSTVTYGTSQARSESHTLEAKFNIPPQTHIEICYDVLFGSFLILPAEPSATSVLSGVWKTPTGDPVSHGIVTLETDGMTITTLTDMNGRFSFRSRRIRPGVQRLRTGGKETILQLGAVPLSRLMLEAAPRAEDLRSPP